jgi:hypothetical protein
MHSFLRIAKFVMRRRTHMLLTAAFLGVAVGVIDPKADLYLKRMSDYLSQQENLSVDATTIDEKVTADGQKIQEIKESRVLLKRPNKLRIERTGPRGHAVLRYDGAQMSLAADERGLYATAPAPSTLDEAIDHARDRLNIDAPGGDLLVSNPYAALTRDVVTGRYVGLEPIDGKMTHHLAMTGKDVDWQIWIADGPRPVPLRYVITSKDMRSQPQFTLEARDWKSEPAVRDDKFSFTPSEGATRVQFTNR